MASGGDDAIITIAFMIDKIIVSFTANDQIIALAKINGCTTAAEADNRIIAIG